jgi:hypothetical protein
LLPMKPAIRPNTIHVTKLIAAPLSVLVDINAFTRRSP